MQLPLLRCGSRVEIGMSGRFWVRGVDMRSRLSIGKELDQNLKGMLAGYRACGGEWKKKVMLTGFLFACRTSEVR